MGDPSPRQCAMSRPLAVKLTLKEGSLIDLIIGQINYKACCPTAHVNQLLSKVTLDGVLKETLKLCLFHPNACFGRKTRRAVFTPKSKQVFHEEQSVLRTQWAEDGRRFFPKSKCVLACWAPKGAWPILP